MLDGKEIRHDDVVGDHRMVLVRAHHGDDGQRHAQVVTYRCEGSRKCRAGPEYLFFVLL